MTASHTVFNVLRNTLDVSDFLVREQRRPPVPEPDEELSAVTWTCRAERPGDAWKIGERLAAAFPYADMQMASDPDGTFAIRVPFRSLAKDWGQPALPSAG